ncbi:MAG: GTPase Era [Bacteroidota bacterium]
MNGLNQNILFRTGYVAIVGEPNVGKSTLMNALVGQKLSIVSKKPQTTRRRILGIVSDEISQIVFLDTPGIIKPKYLLHEAMMAYADSALKDADIIVVLVDVTQPRMEPKSTHDEMWKKIEHLQTPIFLLLNKIDRIEKNNLLPLIEYYNKGFIFKEILPISALNGEGLDELKETLKKYLPEHPPFYPPDIVSEQPERFFVSEIIREKIFIQFGKEIPYSTEVEVVEFTEHPATKDFIRAEIIVERSSQKGILIGKKGAALKHIGETARRDIEIFLERPVFLELYVRVREKWRTQAVWLRRLGYPAH